MTESAVPKRLLSLDVFRGVTIAAMILVNSPGNRTPYHFLGHSAWNGCALADLVFPFFVFIVGVSLAFSLSKELSLGVSRQQLFLKIIKRTIIIFLIGLFLNGFPHFDLNKIRIMGVLQRIALCYMAGAFLFLTTRVRTQMFIFIGILIGYWLLMMYVSVPGMGPSDLSQAGNVGAYLDRLLLNGHLYSPQYDPEGFLSTLPAIATTLLGSLTGIWLMSGASKKIKVWGLWFAAGLALIAGWVMGWWFPINKALWTSSYVLWTGGLALGLLAICYGLIEIKRWKVWALPFVIFGVNAIAAYFLHIFFLIIQQLIRLPLPDGSLGNLRTFLTAELFGWASPQMAALFYAVSYVLFWLGVLWVLYRKKVFIKI